MKNMKTLRVKMVGLLATALILFSAFRADKPVITIFMIGDSTMANKKIDGGNPERGWGMVLPGFFSEDIRIDNHAANGRSSKSFISEGRWEKVISKVKKGDYVFIQFGHNDEKADSTRHTDPGSTVARSTMAWVSAPSAAVEAAALPAAEDAVEAAVELAEPPQAVRAAAAPQTAAAARNERRVILRIMITPSFFHLRGSRTPRRKAFECPAESLCFTLVKYITISVRWQRRFGSNYLLK